MKKLFLLTMLAAMFCCMNAMGADKIQFTTIKKQQKTPACEYELIIAYPLGNSFVENHIKECISEMLGGTYTGDLSNVNALANHYAKERDIVEREGQSDQEIRRTLREWGYGCESMNYVREEISVAHENSKLINLCHSTEHLMCGQNGSPDYDESYLTVRKSDGRVFGMDMLNEKIHSREFHHLLIEGLKEFFSEEDQTIVTDEELSECLFGEDLKDLDLPEGEKIHVTDKYVEFVYRRGEAAIKMVPRVASKIPIKKILPYLTPEAIELLSQENATPIKPISTNSNVNEPRNSKQQTIDRIKSFYDKLCSDETHTLIPLYCTRSFAKQMADEYEYDGCEDGQCYAYWWYFPVAASDVSNWAEDDAWCYDGISNIKAIGNGWYQATIKGSGVKTYIVIKYFQMENEGPNARFNRVTTTPPNVTVENPESDNKIHDLVEQQPQFNGNVNSWLAANLRYPPVAAENGIEGRVIVQFVVEEDGSIHDATVVRGVEAALDREALRVVNSMPNWIPARQNGEVVSCKYTFPVVFRLQ